MSRKNIFFPKKNKRLKPGISLDLRRQKPAFWNVNKRQGNFFQGTLFLMIKRCLRQKCVNSSEKCPIPEYPLDTQSGPGLAANLPPHQGEPVPEHWTRPLVSQLRKSQSSALTLDTPFDESVFRGPES